MTKRPHQPADQGDRMPTDETLDSYDAHMHAQHEHYARISAQIRRTGTWPTATPSDDSGEAA